MPPSQADMDFGLYMYTHQMLPEQIAEQDDIIEEHQSYIQACNQEIEGLKETLKDAAKGEGNVSEQQGQEWLDRIASFENEKKEYEELVREAQKEKDDLVQQRKQAIEEYEL